MKEMDETKQKATKQKKKVRWEKFMESVPLDLQARQLLLIKLGRINR